MWPVSRLIYNLYFVPAGLMCLCIPVPQGYFFAGYGGIQLGLYVNPAIRIMGRTKGVFEIHSNERKKQLVTILKTTAAAAPVTVRTLALLVKASERTVRYDLRSLEDDLRQDGWNLCSKNKCGVWLEPSERESVEETVSYVYTPRERRNLIVVALLTRQMASIDHMAGQLGVSRGTLLGDLKLVQTFLERRGLRYDSKRGQGIRAGGDEMDVRDALIHIFASGTYNFRAFSPETGRGFRPEQLFCRYSRGIPVQRIAACFLGFVAENGLSVSDLSINRMVIALAVQMRRLQEGHLLTGQRRMSFISDEGVFMGRMAEKLAYSLADFEDSFRNENEVQGILKELMHSCISRLRPAAGEGALSVNERALRLAREFIMDVQAWLGDNYIDDEELIYNLAMHLQPAIERAWCGIVFTNPLLLEIQNRYQEIFSICKNAAGRITDKTGIRFSEDEVGYLTVHVGAAVERRKLQQSKKLSVLLVCGNGIGMASLLGLTLQNHLSCIQIVRKISFYQMRDEDLEGIDLIISTMELNMQDKAVLRVSPILSDAEIKILENQIRYVYNRKYHLGLNRLVTSRQQRRLCELLQPEAMELGVSARDWEEAVRISGRILQDMNAVDACYTEGMVRCIKSLGPYMVACPGVAVPHARPEEGAKRVAVSFVQLAEPVSLGREGENIPVDMLFAFSTPDEQSHLEMMLDLWNLFCDENVLNQLRSCRTKESVMYVIRRCIERCEIEKAG